MTTEIHDGTARTGRPTLNAGSTQAFGKEVTLARVIQSELTKLYTLRSVIVASSITVLLIIASGVFAAVGIIVSEASTTPTGGDATADPLGGALTGVNPAMFAVATLGVVAVTSEFISATIQATFAAVHLRLPVVLAKGFALTLILLPVTIASALVALLGAKAVLATEQLTISLTEPGVARASAGLVSTSPALP